MKIIKNNEKFLRQLQAHMRAVDGKQNLQFHWPYSKTSFALGAVDKSIPMHEATDMLNLFKTISFHHNTVKFRKNFILKPSSGFKFQIP